MTFTDDVVTLAPPAEMTPARKEALKAAVGQLGPQGSTNFAGGLLAGLEHANQAPVPPGMVRRVIMFTDGLANVGVATTGPDILALLEANLGSATVSAFGYGEDADQELLRDLASRGKGNYAFVKSPEDALSAFARELGGLLSTYARDVEVVVRPAAGAQLVGVVSDATAHEENGSVRIEIPDILSEEVRHRSDGDCRRRSGGGFARGRRGRRARGAGRARIPGGEPSEVRPRRDQETPEGLFHVADTHSRRARRLAPEGCTSAGRPEGVREQGRREQQLEGEVTEMHVRPRRRYRVG